MVVAVLALSGVSCRDSGKSVAEKAKPPEEVKAQIEGTADRSSSIYGVPLIPEAKLDAAASGGGREVYRVSGKPMMELLNSYWEKMPRGAAFNGLAWCSERRTMGPPFTNESAWRAPNTIDFLVVQITHDPQAPILTIIDDKGNAARTCQ